MTDYTMTVEMPDGILHLSQEFQVPIDEFTTVFAEYVRDIYRYYVDQAGAIRSGAFLESIHIEEGSDERQKYVKADAKYSKVVEMGWTERGRGQDSYPGRYPARDTIEFVIASLDSGLASDAVKIRLKNK